MVQVRMALTDIGIAIAIGSAWCQWMVQVHGASAWCKCMVQVNDIDIDVDIDIAIAIGIGFGNDIGIIGIGMHWR